MRFQNKRTIKQSKQKTKLRIKKQPLEGEKIFASYTSGMGPIIKKKKKSKQLNKMNILCGKVTQQIMRPIAKTDPLCLTQETNVVKEENPHL